jgi:hypothetical protein
VSSTEGFENGLYRGTRTMFDDRHRSLAQDSEDMWKQIEVIFLEVEHRQCLHKDKNTCAEAVRFVLKTIGVDAQLGRIFLYCLLGDLGVLEIP